MPRVMEMDGFTFHMYPNDHPPPHVHVRRSGEECVVLLGDPEGAGSVRDYGDMRPVDARRAVWMVNCAWELLLARWRKLHGKPDS
jgi:hypothetical protein